MLPQLLAAALLAAPPAPVVTRADYIAAQLNRDPVYVTDSVPREITPGQVARIRAAVHRMPVPTYAAVVVPVDDELDPQGPPDRLIALLHDKLRRDGVYLVVSDSGNDITADQFGVNLPLTAAGREVTFSQPYDVGATRAIERFVDDIRSGQAQQRYEKAYARYRSGWEPKPYRKAVDEAGRARAAGAYSGIGVAVLAAAGIALRRKRRRP